MEREQAEDLVAGGLLFDHSPVAKEERCGREWGEVGQDGCCVCKVSKRDNAGRTQETLELR